MCQRVHFVLIIDEICSFSHEETRVCCAEVEFVTFHGKIVEVEGFRLELWVETPAHSFPHLKLKYIECRITLQIAVVETFECLN